MYAIIQTGGKQYKVEKGARVSIETIAGEPGTAIEFSEVLLVGGNGTETARIGTPFVAGSKVKAKVVRQFRDQKVLVFKKRPKKGYKKMQGHRQNLTEVEIEEILA